MDDHNSYHAKNVTENGINYVCANWAFQIKLILELLHVMVQSKQ